MFLSGLKQQKWSEPCRVVRVAKDLPNAGVVVSSLWTNKKRRVARNQLRKIRTVWNRGFQELANATLLCEFPSPTKDPPAWGEMVRWTGGREMPRFPATGEQGDDLIQEQEKRQKRCREGGAEDCTTSVP
eukprot:GHVS01095720.1.p2 GENE.GHVS01095720.1~~GHVS01095720.1.p2  ORF type:complete len:130 (-),score=17.58 GHVS01095720.1:871-1260(-)